MSEGWECLSSESVELISQEFDLLSLLLDNIHQLALVSDLLDLLGRILSAAVVAGLGLEAHDLLALVDVLL